MGSGKYNNKRTEVDGLVFDSKREAICYIKLKALQESGDICGLMTKCNECRFPIVINGVKVCTYVADFIFVDDNGIRVVADAKGYRTREYKLKKKLMLACYRIDITEL